MYRELAADICEIGRRMYQRELVASNDGNISIRVVIIVNRELNIRMCCL